jgi:hypothetical protein
VGCFLYFLAVTNDLNVVFGFYDFLYLQHYGFLMLYLGLTMYHGLFHVWTVRELSAPYQEIHRHRDRMVQDE